MFLFRLKCTPIPFYTCFTLPSERLHSAVENVGKHFISNRKFTVRFCANVRISCNLYTHCSNVLVKILTNSNWFPVTSKL